MRRRRGLMNLLRQAPDGRVRPSGPAFGTWRRARMSQDAPGENS